VLNDGSVDAVSRSEAIDTVPPSSVRVSAHATVIRNHLPRYRLDWTEREAHWSSEPRVARDQETNLIAVPLGCKQILEFDLVIPARRVSVLNVLLGTGDQPKKGVLSVELQNRDGDLLAKSVRDLAQLRNNDFSPILELEDIEFEPGAVYFVRLLCSATTDNEIAVWGYARPGNRGRHEIHRRLRHLSSTRLFAEDRAFPWTPTRVNNAVLVVPAGDIRRRNTLLRAVRESVAEIAFSVIDFDETPLYLPELRAADIVIFANITSPFSNSGMPFDDLCFDLHRYGVCTIFFDDETPAVHAPAHTSWSRATAVDTRLRRLQGRRCHFILTAGPQPILLSSLPGRSPVQPDRAMSLPLTPEGLAILVRSLRTRAAPKVAIVSVAHRSAWLIEAFLERIANQSYPGAIVTVIVDNASPDNDGEVARACGRRLARSGTPNRDVQVVANRERLSSAASRLAGLAAIEADLYLFVDCDCLISRHFVAAHVFEHWWDDVDIVIGPPPVDSGYRDPARLLAGLEDNPELVGSVAAAPDPVLGESFINCASSTYSIKRRHVTDRPLYDFSPPFPSAPNLSWEDVEFGYRVYASGGVSRFTSLAVAVRRPPLVPVVEAPRAEEVRATWALLLGKHPPMAFVARRWQETLLSAAAGRRRTSRPRRLRILTYRWHAGHQYEIYKLPHDFTLVTGLLPPEMDHWSFDQRPLRGNVAFAPVSFIDPRDFDVALLHFDENVLCPQLSNGVVSARWGDAFAWFLGLNLLPKIAVCHGTVPFIGQYAADPGPKNSFVLHELERRRLIDAITAAKVKVVCNSHQADREWEFPDSRVIWHGFDPIEFPPTTLERDILMLSADATRPHYRGAWEQDRVLSRLDPCIVAETAAHAGGAIENRSTNGFAARHFRSYIDRIRQFKIYLNTTLRSPMPRSRDEAMMTGVIPVSLRNHDVDRFVDNGIDGFYADGADALASFINDLLKDPSRVEAMSQAARLKALDVFNHDRYLAAWSELLRETMG
jgi:hypothetical protein